MLLVSKNLTRLLSAAALARRLAKPPDGVLARKLIPIMSLFLFVCFFFSG